MDIQIQTLISKFNEVKEVRKNNEIILSNLALKISALHSVYLSYIKKTTRSEHNFGLDSFYFQKLLLEQEEHNLKQNLSMIDNQMYKDYYKLFRLINKYIKEGIIDKELAQKCISKNTYPIYKDLDPENTYNFNITADLHDNIIKILNELYNYTSLKEQEWKDDEGKIFNGFNIDNFVNTEKYINRQIQQQLAMYLEFLDVFIKFHEKYLSRLNLKIKLIYGEIQSDIKFENNYSPSKQVSEGQTLMNAFNKTDISGANNNILRNLLSDDSSKTPSFIKHELDNIIDALPNVNNDQGSICLKIEIPENNNKINISSELTQTPVNMDELFDKKEDIINEVISEVDPNLIPLPTPGNTNYNTPISSKQVTPVQSKLPTPVQSVTHTPVQSKLPTPVQSVTHTPVQSKLPTPVQSVTHTPVQSKLPTPVQSVTHTPLPSRPQTPRLPVLSNQVSANNSPNSSQTNVDIKLNNLTYQKDMSNIDIVLDEEHVINNININDNHIEDEIIIDNIDIETEQKPENNLSEEQYQQIVDELKDIIKEVPQQIEYGIMQIDPDFGPVMPL